MNWQICQFMGLIDLKVGDYIQQALFDLKMYAFLGKPTIARYFHSIILFKYLSSET